MKKTVFTMCAAAMMTFTGCASQQESMVLAERQQMEKSAGDDKMMNASLEQHALRGEQYDKKEMNQLNN